MTDKPRFYLLAGINGAGKSTFYNERLSSLRLPFINADVIAKEIDPQNNSHSDAISLKAQKLANERRDDFLKQKKSFVSETVFSHPSKIDLLHQAKQAGFLTILVFINLPSVEETIQRIKFRVGKGGHNVPTDKVLARYPRVMENISTAKSVADQFFVFDNLRLDQAHNFVMHLREGVIQRVSDYQPKWSQKLFSHEYQVEQSYKILEPVRRSIVSKIKEGLSFHEAVQKVVPILDCSKIQKEVLAQLCQKFNPILKPELTLRPKEYQALTVRPTTQNFSRPKI